jgi:tRNA modification GTPase
VNETIVAPATPPGTGAISIVRLSGPDCSALAARLFRSNEALRERVATYGTIVDEDAVAIDRGVAILARAPHSYTGEDTLELQVHGSPAIVREVVRAAISCGARAATAGEFTRRAFLNGKLDLHAAAAVADVIAAESRSAARAALANLGGGLTADVRAQRARIAAVLEDLAGAIDFPDEVAEPDRARVLATVNAAQSDLQRLLRDGETGRLVREGASVAIVGPPNAGKSSLLNALLGDDRAIVSEIAGTTRDTIEESLVIAGVRVRLIDTAGIRAHADRLESEGIARSRRAIDAARIVLVVLDGSHPLGDEARGLLEQTADRTRVIFANKSDLGDTGARTLGADVIRGSVRDAATIAALRNAIAQQGWHGETPDLERPHIASAREFDAVRDALDALARAHATLDGGDPIDFVAGELARAHASLGHVSGDTATEELIDNIFARFCIGK